MARQADDIFDVLVIGGAAPGCAVARDAVGRGLTVALVEAADFGGCFAGQLALSGLARALPSSRREAAILRRTCPHLMLDAPPPVPRWRILTRLARRRARPHPLNPQRYAILCARDADDRGAHLFPGTAVTRVAAGTGGWTVHVGDRQMRARLLVDTTGGQAEGLPTGPAADLSLTVSILPATAPAVPGAAFTLPFAPGLVAIGTAGDPPANALWSAGPIAVPASPDGAITLHSAPAPLLSLAPAAACHARRLAEDAVAEMDPFVTMIGKKWTRFAALPGGDFRPVAAADILQDLSAAAPDAPPDRIARLFASYGTEAAAILAQPQGQTLSHGVTEAELSWLRTREWVTSAADVLWRRSALGPQVSGDEIRAIDRFLAA